MPIVPIRFIHQSDKSDLPNNLLDLSLIYRHDFPLASEMFLIEPPNLFKNTLNKLQITDTNSLDVNLNKLNYLLQDQIEIDFKKIAEEIGLDPDRTWRRMINIWVTDLRHQLLSEISTDRTLRPLPCLKNDLIHASGTAYFNKKSKEVVINVQEGSLNIDTESELMVLIQKLDKLFIPARVFHWILTDQFRILDCQLLTQETVDYKYSKKTPDHITITSTSKEIKTVNKVLALKATENFILPENIDGLVISNIQDSEERLFSILESAKSISPSKVIYEIDSLNPTVLSDLEFLKKQKKLDNLEIQIINLGSFAEIEKIIQNLINVGIYKHSIILKLQTPENILNLEKYFELGINHISIDLDNLLLGLVGQEMTDFTNDFYISTLLRFLEPYKRIIFDHKICLNLQGQICLNEDIVQWFISQRVVNFVVAESDVSSLRDYLRFLEKRLFSKISQV